jgi:hypothetical protein
VEFLLLAELASSFMTYHSPSLSHGGPRRITVRKYRNRNGGFFDSAAAALRQQRKTTGPFALRIIVIIVDFANVAIIDRLSCEQ